MNIKLKDEEKAKLVAVEDALTYMAKMANNYTQALQGLIAKENKEVSTIIKNRGVLEGKIKRVDLDKGEIEVSDIKIPSREELNKLKSAGFVTKEEAERAKRIKK